MMGVKIARQKPRQVWLSILYRLSKLPFASKETKQRIYLNLEWLFDRLAHENSFNFYDNTTHPLRVHTQQFLLVKIKSANKVVDLGCVKGVMSNYIADKAALVVGIDYDASAIAEAKANYKKPNLEFRNEEALAYLNNNTQSFDVLILSHILEHLDDPAQFLNNFKRFFKYIYIEVPDFDKNYMNHYRKDLNMTLIYTDDDHVTEFDRDDIRQILDACNIQILDSEHRYGVQKYWCEVK